MTRFTLFLSLLLSASLVACATDSPGALEQAGFRVGCGADDDSCPVSGLDAPLAVGARQHVEIDLQIPGSFSPSAPLVSLAPEIITTQGRELVAQDEGMCAILLVDQAGQVLDFIHLWTAQADGLSLHLLSDQGLDLGRVERNIQMAVGESLRLMPLPQQGELPLLGRFADSQWTLEGEALQLLDEGLGEHRRLRAQQSGSASLQVTAGGLAVALTVEVL